MTDKLYDIIIIGTGAGGGTIARRLAPSGKRILLLERGEFLPREKENWDMKEVFTNGRYLAKEKWLDKDGNEFGPYTHYWVGGNTKVYGAALLRLRESDFGEVRHYGGISPAWPLNYRDLEPYYTQAEYLYSVHGVRGKDPCEPPTNKPYPFPPVIFEPKMKEIYNQIKKLGYNPFPMALGVRLGQDHPGPHPPTILSNFDGYPDPTGSKADAEVCAVLPALENPNVELKTGHYVDRLETDSSGKKVISIVAKSNGREIRYTADLVIVACGAINSAALFLRSVNDKHVNGLANSSDLVGRNYMSHQNGMVIAISKEENPSQFQKAFAMTDFYHGADDSELPLGTIQLMGKPDADFLESLARKHLPNLPAEKMWTHTVDFFITSEDLPDPDNRVTVTKNGQIRLSYNVNNTEAYERLRKKLVSLFDFIGCEKEHLHHHTYVGPKLGISGVSHQNGTMRFGTDPDTSVLDVNCRTHDLDNVYVVDASFFPSSGAVNPTLMIIANALRVGDHILDQIK